MHTSVRVDRRLVKGICARMMLRHIPGPSETKAAAAAAAWEWRIFALERIPEHSGGIEAWHTS